MSEKSFGAFVMQAAKAGASCDWINIGNGCHQRKNHIGHG